MVGTATAGGRLLVVRAAGFAEVVGDASRGAGVRLVRYRVRPPPSRATIRNAAHHQDRRDRVAGTSAGFRGDGTFGGPGSWGTAAGAGGGSAKRREDPAG